MQHQSKVNGQVADQSAQTNAQTIGESPAVSLSQLYMATAQALSLAAHNAAAQQQHTNQLAQAATAQGVAMLLGINSANLGFPAPPTTNPPSNPSNPS